jgi:glycogen debranching enzyme
MREWLVTDGWGGFAMGTHQGTRRRKYHGFFQTIPGRGETAWLADLEIECGGEGLWAHWYASDAGPVRHPRPPEAAFQPDPWPQWTWTVNGAPNGGESGQLTFRVEPARPGPGIRLAFVWRPRRRQHTELRIRPLFAGRDLHAMGGQKWSAHVEGNLARIAAADGRHAYLTWKGEGEDAGEWCPDPHWYRNFHYSEEEARGYLAREDLHSAGVLRFALPGRTGEAAIVVSEREPSGAPVRRSSRAREQARPAALDFALEEPAGIVAGYPWFGEWGRDTFISLPGLAAARLRAGEPQSRVVDWCGRILSTWGEWIQRSGMIPNLVEKGGAHQWESADGTLWWGHAVAALWSLGFERLARDQLAHLEAAIGAIQGGRHLFLRLASDGLLEVTEPHATWMDARVDGQAVTPRTGKLPEINALWLQAHALHKLLSKRGTLAELEPLARAMLDPSGPIREEARPNRVFLHSLPLAPSFLFPEAHGGRTARTDLTRIRERLWTPVGLRTLDPSDPAYRPRCVGTQRERDEAYHQGSVWPWLGGHFEMMADRQSGSEEFPQFDFTDRPIARHVPEIYDGDAPHAARGAPAQAWSLATLEEARWRREKDVDAQTRRRLGALPGAFGKAG